jgi:TonB-dependent receptor
LFARLNSDFTDHNQTISYDDGRMNWRLRQGENVTDQQMHSLKLNYDLNFLTANISANYTSSGNILDESPVLDFNQTQAVRIVGRERDNKVPQDLLYLQSDFHGDSAVVLRSGNLFSSDYKETKYTYKADFEVPYSMGTAVSGFFKFGGQIYNQENTNDQETPYLGFNGSVNSTDQGIQTNLMKTIRDEYGITVNNRGELTGQYFINPDKELFDPFLNDKYGDIYFLSDPDKLVRILKYIIGKPEFDASNSDYSIGREGGWYDGPYQQLTNDYKYNEDYYAGYAMTRVNWMDFMLIGGLRYEKVHSEYFAYNARDIRNAQQQVMYDTTSITENEFVLPMGQIKYSPFEWMDVRYAYTQTLARPDYSSISPKFTISNENPGNVFTGNPDLKPAKAFNHDLSFTFHANKLGLLTIGGFYKTIENFVYGASYRLDAADRANIDTLSRYQVIRNGGAVVSPYKEATIYRPLNNPYDATVKGLELDFQHNFWYLPAPFNNMVFGINYARIFSKTRYPFYDVEVQVVGRDRIAVLIDSSSSGRLIDQPNHVLNSYIGYDYKGFSSRLSFLFQDNSNRNNGGAYPENNSFTKEYFRIDFSARQKLPFYNSELFLDVTNLNDQNTSWIQRSTGGFQGIQNYGLTANLGIRIRY